ncbi:unknown [Clostridium sp. CAG:715]|nr:unknown [Clostridium sp. CAG:715]
MNILQKIVYYFLEKQEKALTKRLSRHLRTSSSNSTSKTVVSKGVTMTLNAETERNKDLVLKNVSDIIKGCNSDISKLLAFIESKGTKVIRLENADKILSVIKEEEGLITPLEGIEALYINTVTHSGFSLKSKPMFVMRNGQIDPYYMAHQFYKWYALQMKLPGFDFMTQKIFKIYLNSDGAILSNLTLDEMTGLKEAIARDQEATTFALDLAKQKEGSKKVLEKMQDGGANV